MAQSHPIPLADIISNLWRAGQVRPTKGGQSTVTLTDLAKLVKRMRDKQRIYCQTQSAKDFNAMYLLESGVDSALEAVLADPGLSDQPQPERPA